MDKLVVMRKLSTALLLDREKMPLMRCALFKLRFWMAQNGLKADTPSSHRLGKSLVLVTLLAIECIAFRDGYE